MKEIKDQIDQGSYSEEQIKSMYEEVTLNKSLEECGQEIYNCYKSLPGAPVRNKQNKSSTSSSASNPNAFPGKEKDKSNSSSPSTQQGQETKDSDLMIQYFIERVGLLRKTKLTDVERGIIESSYQNPYEEVKQIKAAYNRAMGATGIKKILY